MLAATWSRNSVFRCTDKPWWFKRWLAAFELRRSSMSIIGSLCQRWIWLLNRFIALFKCGSELLGSPMIIASGAHSVIMQSSPAQSWRPLLTTNVPAGVAVFVKRLPLAAPVRFKPISKARNVSASRMRWVRSFLAMLLSTSRVEVWQTSYWFDYL